jgi:galactose-6-phosphate isomerase
MALIDVSELLTDPDFTNTVTLIRRSSTVDTYGENTMVETSSSITAVVQGAANTESLERVPEGARLSDLIDVYYKGQLTAESPGGYADIIVWQGKRYQVFEVVEDFTNYGAGFTKAVCKLEAVNA